MNNPGSTESAPARPAETPLWRFVVPAAGVAAVCLTFFAANADIGNWRSASAAFFALAFVAVCWAADRAKKNLLLKPDAPQSQQVDRFFDEYEDRLTALDEANEVFGSSLNASDMFRLVASRVNEIFPFAAVGLAVPDESGETLRFVHFDGENADAMRDVGMGIADGLAGWAFMSGEVEIENGMSRDWLSIGRDRLTGFVSSAAIPLVQEGSVFAVMQIFSGERMSADEDARKVLEAIGEHVTPIFRSSLAFEKSLSSALTDALTGLPNERAFYMVLENQLAESVRNREERPLTVLSIDIRDFGAVNSMLGHAVGDRMLEFTGVRIGEHLRKMDFLARTVNDEFSVVLPTATEQVAFEIIDRIRAGFTQNEFEIADGEGVTVSLNVGWASFWKDGETAEQLVRAAQQRKRQTKSEEPLNLLWFPKEYVN